MGWVDTFQGLPQKAFAFIYNAHFVWQVELIWWNAFLLYLPKGRLSQLGRRETFVHGTPDTSQKCPLQFPGILKVYVTWILFGKFSDIVKRKKVVKRFCALKKVSISKALVGLNDRKRWGQLWVQQHVCIPIVWGSNVRSNWFNFSP